MCVCYCIYNILVGAISPTHLENGFYQFRSLSIMYKIAAVDILTEAVRHLSNKVTNISSPNFVTFCSNLLML